MTKSLGILAAASIVGIFANPAGTLAVLAILAAGVYVARKH